LAGDNFTNNATWNIWVNTNIQSNKVKQTWKNKKKKKKKGRKLSDGSYAILFMNMANKHADLKCDKKCFNALGLNSSSKFKVRDLWLHRDIGSFGIPFHANKVKPDGGSVTFKFTPQ